MTASAAAASALVAVGIALLVWPTSPLAVDVRGNDLDVGRSGRGSGRAAAGAGRFGPAGRLVTGARRWAAAIGLPMATAVLAPDWWWCGVLGAVPLAGYLARRTDRPSAAQVCSQRRELAGRLDLVSACLQSGLPIGSALVAVGATGSAGATAVRPWRTPIEVLDEVAAMLMVGADSQAAWRPAAQLPELASVAAAACRSAAGGTALAAAFTEQADQLRRQNADSAATAAGRAGVLMTAPLGACFLPAFLCLGLAPAVVGLLGTMHLW